MYPRIHRLPSMLLLGASLLMLACGCGGNDESLAQEPQEETPLARRERLTQEKLKYLCLAQQEYQLLVGKYGSLQDLFQAGVITDERLGLEGKGNGYLYQARPQRGGFHLLATPERYGEDGRRSFYMADGGVLRARDLEGEEASMLEAKEWEAVR